MSRRKKFDKEILKNIVEKTKIIKPNFKEVQIQCENRVFKTKLSLENEKLKIELDDINHIAWNINKKDFRSKDFKVNKFEKKFDLDWTKI